MWGFLFITLETAEPENRETAAYHSGKGACVYATYRDRSVFAVEYSRRLYDRLKLPPSSIRSRCCLNHALLYPDNLISCVCSSISTYQEGTEA